MPPADQNSKKPGTDDSLLGDFDFGDEDFNWDQLADAKASASFDSEEELPPELRKAVVKGSEPLPTATTAETTDKTQIQPTESAVQAPETASVESKPTTPKAASAFDPLALPPLDGDAAPLPPLGSAGGLLGDFDLDFPIGPKTSGVEAKPATKPEATPKAEAKPEALPPPSVAETKAPVAETKAKAPEAKPVVAETKPVVAETKPPVAETKPIVVEPAPPVVTLNVDDDEDDYDVQIDAAPAESKSVPVVDPSMSDLLPDFGVSPAGTGAGSPAVPSEPSVELSLPPPPALTAAPVATEAKEAVSRPSEAKPKTDLAAAEPLPPPPASDEPLPPPPAVVAVSAPISELPIAATSTRDSFVSLPPIQPGRAMPLRNQGTPIVPRRLPLPSVENLPPPPPCAASGAALETAARRVVLGQFDAETRSHGDDRNRTARLLLAAGMQAEALRENSEAIERYRRALDVAPNNRTALRGLRRLLQVPGPTAQPDEAATLIEREQKLSSATEQSGLSFQRLELLRASGQLGEAKNLAQEFLASIPRGSHKLGQNLALVAQTDITLAQGNPSEIAPILDGVLAQPSLAAALRPALQVHRARLDEPAGRDQATAQRFEAAFGQSPTLSAALGWLRTAARLPRLRKEEPSPLAKVAKAVQSAAMPSPLKASLLRLSARQSPGAEQKVALTEAAQLGDSLAWDELALQAEQAKDFAAAASAYAKSAESRRDPWLRSEALRLSARAWLHAGQDEAAQRALVDALSVAAQTDGAEDGVSYRLLERVCRKLGRPSDLLQLWRKQGESSDGQGVFAFLYAAEHQLQSVEGEAGREAAMAELRAALKVRPDFHEAAQRLAALHLAANQPVEAAQVLLKATQQAESETLDELCRRVLREEAAAQLSRIGQHAEAAKVLLADAVVPGPVSDVAPTLSPARSWQLALLATRLRGIAEPTILAQLGEVLHQAAGNAQGSAAADLWFARGNLLASLQPAPSPEGGPVEESFRQALLHQPGHTMALQRLAMRAAVTPRSQLAHSPLAHFVTSGLRARFEHAKGQPSQPWWGIQFAVSEDLDASEPVAALRTYRELLKLTDGQTCLRGLDDWMYVTAWRAGQGLDLLERELAQDPDSDTRYALLLLSGEQLEAQGKPKQAAERYQQALELRPGHPVAKAKLTQAYLAAGMLDELSKFTAAELKDATDIATRVQAFERQAVLANLQLRDPLERSEAIEHAYRNVLTVDASNHLAMRLLERHFIARGQWGELIQLYEQMGLTATDTPFAVHISSDRARLRQRLLWQHGGDAEATHNQMENDFRLALYRDRSCRPALRLIHEGAVQRDDQAQIAELSQWIGELPINPGPGEQSQKRSAAVFLTRAAEAASHSGGDADRVIAIYQSALSKAPDQLPTLRGLLHYAILHQRHQVALDAAEQLGDLLYDTEERYLHYMLVGVLATNLVPDAVRARKALRKGLTLLPDREEAFERLRVSYATTSATSAEDAKALSELLKERLLRQDLTTDQVASIRVELGQLYAGQLKNRAMAKYELGEALRLKADQPAALYMLGKLHADDSEWQHAIDPLRRYGQLETRPAQLLALHLLLGEIFSEQLHDPQQALSEYAKAIQIQPTNQAALTKLADLFLAQNRASETLPLLKRLVKYTEDKQRKIGYYHRIAGLSELQGDSRGALEALRQAVEVDPVDLPAIRELALFYERSNDVTSLRFHLEAAAGRFRHQLVGKPRELAIHQALLQILVLRRSEQAHLAAGAITSLGGMVSKDIQAQLEKLPQKGATKNGLRDPSLDETLYPAVVSPSIRMVFRLLAEPLGKLYISDGRKLQSLGVDRKDKLPRSGHPVRDLANKMAADLGIGDFDIYLTAAQGKDESGQTVPHYTIEPLEPPALIISNVLLDGASEAERRFVLGGLLKILQCQLHLPLRMSSEELAVLFGGLVRQQVKDYVPVGFADKRIEAEAQRQRRAFPSKLATQIVPLAMEFYAAVPNYDGIAKALLLSSHFFGLLWCGNLQAAVSSLRRRGAAAEKLIDELYRFALSREADELLRILHGS